MEGVLLSFNSERADTLTKMYLLGNGFRGYRPVLMRFNAPDDWSPFGEGGINPYTYCTGDPINRADPSGHLSGAGIAGIVMGVLGLGLALFTGGASIAAAIAAAASESTAMAAAGVSWTAVALWGIGVTADVTAIASSASEGSNPGASAALGWVSLITGFVGMFAGAKGASRWLQGGRSMVQVPRNVMPEVQVPELAQEMLINVNPENPTPTQFFKAVGIEVKYSRNSIKHRRILGFTSDFNGQGEPGLVLHRNFSNRLNFDFGFVSVVEGTEIVYGRQEYTINGLVNYFMERGIDLKNISGDKPLHLVACAVGGREGAAQMLANTLQRNVIAYGRKAGDSVYHPGISFMGNGKVLADRSDRVLQPQLYQPENMAI